LSASTTSIGVPSAKGMKEAFGDFAVGAGGGLVFALARALLGSGLIGALAAPVIAGSIVRGARGTALSTVAGFLLLSGLLGGGSANASSNQSNGRGVM